MVKIPCKHPFTELQYKTQYSISYILLVYCPFSISFHPQQYYFYIPFVLYRWGTEHILIG